MNNCFKNVLFNFTIDLRYIDKQFWKTNFTLDLRYIDEQLYKQVLFNFTIDLRYIDEQFLLMRTGLLFNFTSQ